MPKSLGVVAVLSGHKLLSILGEVALDESVRDRSLGQLTGSACLLHVLLRPLSSFGFTYLLLNKLEVFCLCLLALSELLTYDQERLLLDLVIFLFLHKLLDVPSALVARIACQQGLHV